MLTRRRPIDVFSTYHVFPDSAKAKTSNAATQQPTRYAVRQVLDQELRKEKMLQASVTRQARGSGALLDSHLLTLVDDKSTNEGGSEQKTVKVKRDFFGRPIAVDIIPTLDDVASTKIDASSIAKSTATKGKAKDSGVDESGAGRIWVSFHEGFSNAVRKPITLNDLMDSF